MADTNDCHFPGDPDDPLHDDRSASTAGEVLRAWTTWLTPKTKCMCCGDRCDADEFTGYPHTERHMQIVRDHFGGDVCDTCADRRLCDLCGSVAELDGDYLCPDCAAADAIAAKEDFAHTWTGRRY